jgi:hypothetical protein
VVSLFGVEKPKLLTSEEAFKAKYPNRKDFQGAWVLRRVF